MTLYSTASVGPKIREIAMFNSTATACVYELVTFSTAGTQGASIGTPGTWDPGQGAAACALKHASSSTAPTVAARLGILFPLAAAVGSGVIRQFNDLAIAIGTGNGLGLLVHTGTGQLCDIDITWLE
jgi:hypothetical protein